MRILIACIHYPVASGRYIARALRRLGHEVRSVGPATGNRIWGMSVDMRWAWAPDYAAAESGHAAWDAWRPELVITADSAYTLRGVTRCPHVVWGVDNHVRNYWPAREFDALFLAHSQGARMGEPNMHWLPCAYDPEVHTDLGLAREVDVALVGVAYGPRVELVQALAEAGLTVQAATGLLWDDYNAAYNRAKIALVKSAAGDVAMRVFENMAQGCCVLMDRCPDMERLGFVEGEHYAAYTDAEDCVRQARRLLHTGLWQAMARRGQAAVRPHTWDARAEQLLDTVFSPQSIVHSPQSIVHSP